jgi:hypothetical protein
MTDQPPARPTVPQRAAHRAATLAHAEVVPTVPPPPPSPPRPRGSLHNATTSPSLDVPGAAEGRAWAEHVRTLPLAEQLAAVVEQVAAGMATQAQQSTRLDGLDGRLASLREHIDQRLDAADQRLERMGADVTSARQELTGARAALGAASARGIEAVTRAQRAEAQAREAAAVAGLAAELAGSERSDELEIPAALRESMGDPRETVNTGSAASRPPSQGRRRHETPPAGSMPLGRPAATEDDVTALRQDIAELRSMLAVAARGDRAQGARLDDHDTGLAWVRRRLGWLALALTVGGYLAKLSWESWERRHPPALPPTAVLARPGGSAAPVTSGGR